MSPPGSAPCAVASGVAEAGSGGPERIGFWVLGLALGLAVFVGAGSRLSAAWAQDEIFVTDAGNNSVMVYPRTAAGETFPLRTLAGPATGLNVPTAVAVTASKPSARARLTLNQSAFQTGQMLTYQATLTPGSTSTQVDIYLGALLPDGITFVSLVMSSPGAISLALGPLPIPFSANVPLVQAVVPFSYIFTGAEPAGTYFDYAGITIAGSDPLTRQSTQRNNPGLPVHAVTGRWGRAALRRLTLRPLRSSWRRNLPKTIYNAFGPTLAVQDGSPLHP